MPTPCIPELRYVGFKIAHYHVFGRRGSWAEVRRLLEPFDPEHLCGFISWLSFFLIRTQTGLASGSQEGLVRLLFPDNWRQVLGRSSEVASRSGAAMAVVISDDQLLSATKATILYARGSLKPGGESLQAIGEALLMLNDLDDVSTIVLRDDHGLEDSLLAIGTAMGTFFHADELLHRFTRSHLLFLQDRPHLKGCPNYIDFPHTCRTLLGIDPEAFWTFAFAINGRWNHDGAPSLADDLSIDFDSWCASFRLLPEETKRLKDWMTTDYYDLRNLCINKYADDHRPFDHQAFSGGPLVTFGTRSYCPLPSLLVDRLGTGLYHLYVSKLPKEARARFFSYAGYAFEDYIHLLMERIFPRIVGRYLRISETPLEAMEGKKCDALLNSGEDVVLFEFKSKIRAIAARTGASMEKVEEWIEMVYVEPAIQLDHTAQAIERGILTAHGVDPRHVRRYWPVIVTLESTPLLPSFETFIQKRIEAMAPGFPICKSLMPWQVMHVSEVEYLEVAVNDGYAVHELLAQKLKAGQAQSFRNHWFEREHAFRKKNNPFLQEEFDRITEHAMDFCKQRLGSESNASGS